MIPVIAIRRISALIVFLITASCLGLAQNAPSSAAEKSTPKVTYLLVGRLFDATSDNIRENMVIAIEGERIKTVASAADLKIPPGTTYLTCRSRLFSPV